MPRYVVERTFPEGLRASRSMTWARRRGVGRPQERPQRRHRVYLYVSQDHRKTFCVDGPSPESIREAAASNNQPVDSITAVNVLDPYFYRP